MFDWSQVFGKKRRRKTDGNLENAWEEERKRMNNILEKAVDILKQKNAQDINITKSNNYIAIDFWLEERAKKEKDTMKSSLVIYPQRHVNNTTFNFRFDNENRGFRTKRYIKKILESDVIYSDGEVTWDPRNAEDYWHVRGEIKNNEKILDVVRGIETV